MTSPRSPQSAPRASVRIGPSWVQIVALVVAVAFATGSLVYYLDHREQDPNSADIGFLDDMGLHHQQAIFMSFAYFKNTTARQLANTATEIVTSQAGDMRVMGRLRGDWPESDGNDEGTVMEWMGMKMPIQQMPGFATEAELNDLDTLRGRPLDDHFTAVMIRHHLGGIEMAREALKRANVDAVKDLARSIITLQNQEIDELNDWRRSADLPAITDL
jgi:uncharacterized protein (DUF305 family)